MTYLHNRERIASLSTILLAIVFLRLFLAGGTLFEGSNATAKETSPPASLPLRGVQSEIYFSDKKFEGEAESSELLVGTKGDFEKANFHKFLGHMQGDKEEPMSLSADVVTASKKGEDVELLFEGNVVFQRGAIFLTCNQAKLLTKEKKIVVMEDPMGGLAHMKTDQLELFAKELVFYMDEKMTALLHLDAKGEVRLLIAGQNKSAPIAVSAETMHYDAKKEEILFEAAPPARVIVLEPSRGLSLSAASVIGKRSAEGDFEFRGVGKVNLQLSEEQFQREWGGFKSLFGGFQ